MPNQILASNKRELTLLILDLCGYSLDQAGYHKDVYSFHLHLAFRRQTILDSERWAVISTRVLELEEGGDNDELSEVLAFAQAIVTDVQAAENDSLAIRLLKAGYLSQLDKARRSSEQAIRLLAQGEPGFNQANASISDLPVGDKYRQLLMAHIAHLDSLLLLPFILERLCIRLSNNLGINYLPQKNAQVLVTVLDNLNHWTDKNYNLVIAALKLALRIAMPALPLDSDLLATILNEAIPFVDRFIRTNQAFKSERDRVLPPENPDEMEACSRLLASLGVHLDELETLVEKTLLEPVQLCAAAVGDLEGIVVASSRLIKNTSLIDRSAQLNTLFGHFDRLASLPDKIGDEFLPAWLIDANHYYQGFRQTTTYFQDQVEHAAISAFNGLGQFFSRLVSFVPESMRRYFSAPDDLTRLLQSLDGDTAAMTSDAQSYDFTIFACANDPRAVLAALTFYDLTEKAGFDESMCSKLFRPFFREVYPDSSNEMSYEEYQIWVSGFSLLAKHSLPMLVARAGHFQPISPAHAPYTIINDNKKIELLLAVQQLQDLELTLYNRGFQQELFETLFHTLQACRLSAINDFPSLFRERYLEPAINRILNHFQTRELLPLLENNIDRLDSVNTNIRAELDSLPLVYSKIKSQQPLSVDELMKLRSCFSDNTRIGVPLFKWSIKLTSNRLAPNGCPLEPTPHQQLVTRLKALFPLVDTGLKLILAQLHRQYNDCNHLLDLVKGSSLEPLCQSKLNYLLQLRAIINTIKLEIRTQPDTQAAMISGLIFSGAWDRAEQLISDLDCYKISKQLIRFSWHVLLKNSLTIDEQFVANLINYYFKNTALSALFNAHHEFFERLNTIAVPELMPLLNDPLAPANLLPGSEEFMDQVIEQLIGLDRGSSTVLGWAANLIGGQTNRLIGAIRTETLASVLPYHFLGQVAFQVIQSDIVRNACSALILNLTEQYHDSFRVKAEAMITLIKDHLYALLGIQIERSIELRVMHYVQKGYSRDEEDSHIFSMYYLQYRAIRQMNPEVLVPSLLGLLFHTLSVDELDDLGKAFDDFDKMMGYGSYIAASSSSNTAEPQLEFLLRTLDLADPENQSSIRLILLNRLLVMSLASAQQLGQARQEEAIQTFATIYEELKAPLADRLTLLKESRERAQDLLAVHLRTRAEEYRQGMEAASRLHQQRLNDNMQEPQLNRSVGAVNRDLLKNNWPRLLYKIGIGVYESLSFVSFWASIVTPLVFSLGGTSVLQAVFTILGITGAIGATATIVGAVTLGIMFLIRFGVKLGQEIKRQLPAFKDAANNPAYSPGKKTGLVLLTIMNCLGWALFRSAFTDFIFAKFKRLVPSRALGLLQDELHVYPSEAQISAEQEALNQLNGALERLIDEVTDERLDDVIIASHGVWSCYQLAATNDMRRFNDELTAMIQVQIDMIDEIKAMRQTLRSLQEPQVASLEASSSAPFELTLKSATTKKNTDAKSRVREPIVMNIQLLAAYQEMQKQVLENNNSTVTALSLGHIPNLISGFYRALAYAGRFFTWRWFQQPVVQASSSLSFETSSRKMLAGLSTTLVTSHLVHMGDSLNAGDSAILAIAEIEEAAGEFVVLDLAEVRTIVCHP